jgi:flagella basal body P-ring formation protein FlgA
MRHPIVRHALALVWGAGLMASLPAAWADGACEAATVLLKQAASARQLEVEVACRPPADAIALTGHWQAQGGLPALVSGPARVGLQSAGPGPRSLALPVVLTVKSTVWLTRRALAAGQPVGPQDLVREPAFSWPVGLRPAPGEAKPPLGRARQFVRAGEVLSSREVVAADELMRGDPVTLTVRRGAMTIEQPAVLVADAQVGQMTRVQIKGRREVVEAWITAPTLVVLDH